ncbi:uncharacterized protein [Anabrus simplex]|uniref:uncharacterized protein n=1 Tax=Anabrus simplex TaxID=316456 RepID=UPI0035A32D61
MKIIILLIMVTAASSSPDDCNNLTFVEPLVEKDGKLYTRATFKQQYENYNAEGSMHLTIQPLLPGRSAHLPTECERCYRNRSKAYVQITEVTTSYQQVEKEMTAGVVRVQITLQPTREQGVLFGEKDILTNCRNLTACLHMERPTVNFRRGVWNLIGTSPLEKYFWNTWSEGLMPRMVQSLSINISDDSIPARYLLRLRSPSMKRLQISGNFWEDYENELANFFTELKSTLPSLQQLSLANNSIVKIPLHRYIFYGPNTSLQSLDLSYNRLSKVPRGFNNFKHLSEINFSNQMNDSVLYISDHAINDLKKIEKLDFTNTNLNVTWRKFIELMNGTVGSP